MAANVRTAYGQQFKDRTDLTVTYVVQSMDLQTGRASVRVTAVNDLTFSTKSTCRIQTAEVLSVEQTAGTGDWYISSLSPRETGRSGRC